MSRIAVEFGFAALAVLPFGVVFTDTFAGCVVADAPRLVAVVVAVASAAALPRGRVAVAAGLTRLTKFTLRPVLTFVAATHSSLAGRMIVTSAVNGAVGAGPSEVAMTFVLRSTAAVAVHAIIVTSSHATFFPVPDVTLLAFTSVRAVRVVTDGVLVAVVEAEAALVHVGALGVRPARVRRRHIQERSAIHMRTSEITFRANAVDGVFKGVTPTAPHTSQAGRALRVRLTGFALSGLARGVVGGRRRGGAVEPLAAQAELVLAGVDAEAEALARGLAPDAAAALV